jgi:hypothetical protein
VENRSLTTMLGKSGISRCKGIEVKPASQAPERIIHRLKHLRSRPDLRSPPRYWPG